jgi:hypothetical protein
MICCYKAALLLILFFFRTNRFFANQSEFDGSASLAASIIAHRNVVATSNDRFFFRVSSRLLCDSLCLLSCKTKQKIAHDAVDTIDVDVAAHEQHRATTTSSDDADDGGGEVGTLVAALANRVQNMRKCVRPKAFRCCDCFCLLPFVCFVAKRRRTFAI